MTKVIGLTGGIATGKSTLSAILREQGYHVIDADAIVHDLQNPGGRLSSLIADSFGPEFFDEEGNLNRKRLAELVFSDSESYQKLSEIQNGVIREELLKQLSLAKEVKRGLVFMDIPLLFEGHYEPYCDEVWLVTTSEENQIARLEQRSHLTRQEALLRIRQQMPQKDKMQLSDVVFDNSGSVEDLKGQILQQLKRVSSS